MNIPFSAVVVVVGDNLAAAADCITAVAAQVGTSDELLVPADDRVAALLKQCALPPRARLIPVTGHHADPPRLRAAGVGAATGQIVGVIEDLVHPVPTWRDAFVSAHNTLPHTVIGGVIGKGLPDDPAGWAAWLMDYGRYHPGVTPGAVSAVSSCNVAYKHAALQEIRSVWADTFRETAVHAALHRRDGALWLIREAEVTYTCHVGLNALAAAWQVYGREFGADRRALEPSAKRWWRLATSPLVAPILTSRALSRLRQLPQPHPAPVSVLPALLTLSAAWALGEAEGALGT